MNISIVGIDYWKLLSRRKGCTRCNETWARSDTNYDQMQEEADRGTKQYARNIEFQLRLLITFSGAVRKTFRMRVIFGGTMDNYISMERL